MWGIKLRKTLEHGQPLIRWDGRNAHGRALESVRGSCRAGLDLGTVMATPADELFPQDFCVRLSGKTCRSWEAIASELGRGSQWVSMEWDDEAGVVTVQQLRDSGAWSRSPTRAHR